MRVVLVFALLSLPFSGCGCEHPGPARFLSPPRADAGRDAPFFFGPSDTGPPRIDAPDASGVCTALGTMGAHCRSATCSGSMCQLEITREGAPLTLRSAFRIEQGTDAADAEGFHAAVDDAVAADDVPLPIASGSLCTERCDTFAPVDGCGPCASCDTAIGTTQPLLTTARLEVDPPFGEHTGWCRADCTFDPSTAGATCPTATGPGGEGAHTCAPGSNTCVEGCVSDNECRYSLEETREGLFVSVLDRSSDAAQCDPITHRCRWFHEGDHSVGDPCESRRDCTADVGVCLRGGTCAEYQCATDPATVVDPDGGSICDDGAGVCLGNGGNGGSICVAGCNTSDDCNPFHVCIPLEGVLGDGRIGAFTGYCFAGCDTRLDDPDGAGPLTTADDEVLVCRSGEACDDPRPSATDLDPMGTCRTPCSLSDDCNGADGSFCELVPGTSPAYGFCRWTDRVCDYADLSSDCFGGQVCDLLAWPDDLGLCIEPCTDETGASPCPDPGDVCVPGTASAPRRVCRTPCIPGGAPCDAGETCLMGYCEQLTAG